MVVFVCGLLFYANAVAFNLISAPIYISDIITYAALTVAVTLTIITLTIVIRDKRRSLFAKTQKSIVANSNKKSIELPSAFLLLADSQENTDKVESNPAVVQIANESDKAPVTPLPRSSIKKSLVAILIAITLGLLLFVNVVSFKMIPLPQYAMYVAVVGATGLIGVMIVVAIVEKRRGAVARIQKASVVSAVEELNEPLERVSSSFDFQESTSVVETDKSDIQTLNVSTEAQVVVLPKAKLSKKRNVLVLIIIIAVGLVFFANFVAFGLISLPGYFAYAFVFGASALTIITVAIALVDKRKGALPKTPIVEVVGEIEESKTVPETPDTISSPTIAQTIADKVESNIATIETTKVPDKTPAPITPSSKVLSKRNLFAIIFAFTVGLLIIANAGAFDLINLPKNSTYAFISGATTLTIVTIAIALVDKRKNETPKVPDEKTVPITRLAKVFGKRNLFAIIFAFTVGLLIIANAGAFDLINLPENSIYAAVAGAVALEAITLTIILGEKIKVLGHRIKSFLTEPKIQEVIKEDKELGQAPAIAPVSVITQTSTKKVDPYVEMLRQLGVQKTARKLEADNAEQQKKLPKKPVIPPTKVICPACRKEFNLAIYERDYIVDFGPTKKTNLIKICPNCQASIPLKRRGILGEENILKE